MDNASTPQGLRKTERCDGHILELVVTAAHEVFLRVTTFHTPHAAQAWHGPFGDEQDALNHFRQRHSLPRIRASEIARAKRSGQHGRVNDVPMLCYRHPWTGLLTLTPYELVEEDEDETAKPCVPVWQAFCLRLARHIRQKRWA